MLEKIFGTSYKTAFSSVLTAMGLVPLAINSLGLTEIPEWLRVTGIACSFVFYIYSGMQQKDKDVTGAGTSAKIVDKQ